MLNTPDDLLCSFKIAEDACVTIFRCPVLLQKHAFIIFSDFAFLILPERNNNFLNNEFNFRMVVLIFCKVCTMCWSGFDIICGEGIVILAYETSNIGTHPSQNMQWIIQASQISKSLRERKKSDSTFFESTYSSTILTICNNQTYHYQKNLVDSY